MIVNNGFEREVFQYLNIEHRIICASCGEELADEDLANTTCLKCGGEAD